MLRYLTFVIILLVIQSCSSTMPSGFWKKFEANCLTREISDQGPWGGYRALYWKSNKSIFNSSNVLAFATKNGWKFKDSINFSLNDKQNWNHNGNKIFPLSHHGFTPIGNYSSTEFDNFPLNITSNLIVFIFETDWVKVDPGTAETTDAFGYIVLNKDKSEMAVYHLWGD